MSGILLLNATYEPLCVVSLRRAVVLVLSGKASIVEEDEEQLHAASLVLPRPVVIRLTAYVHVPYRGSVTLTRSHLMVRDQGRCQYCGRAGDTIDHVLPRARGGKHEWENVVVACRKCNHAKDDKLLSELGWTLPRQPVAPHGSRWALHALSTHNPTWEPYLLMGAYR